MDPYVKITGFCRRQGAKGNPPGIAIGKVMSPPPNLIINVNDMPLDKDNILIADFLLSGYSRQINITGGSGTAINMTDQSLNVDDAVAIMPTIDGQTWLLLCKVVSP